MPKSNKPINKVSVATNKNSMFNAAKKDSKEPFCNVNVEINIDQKDDFILGCFKAIAGIFKKP